MNPLREAQAVYFREETPRAFLTDLCLHLENPTGYVFKTPTLFCLARPVDRLAPTEEIIEPRIVFPPERCNAWFVYLLAGRVTEVFAMIPYPLPYFGWQKKNRLRFWPAGDIARKFQPNHEPVPAKIRCAVPDAVA
jgi:hypothetical protein